MSLRAWILNAGLKGVEKPYLARVERPEDIRESFERKARLLFGPPRGTRVDTRDLGGRPALVVTPPGLADDAPRLLYLHGGGYVFGSPTTHAGLAGAIAARIGAVAILPDYRLAPEHPFPAAFEDAVAAHGALCAEAGAPAFLGGDSAGGGLALALLAQLAPEARPDAAFAFSPLTDLAFTGASFTENRQSEVLLPATRAGELAEMYLDGADPSDPRASPLHASFDGAPPVWLSVSGTEILRDDTLRIAQAMRAAGVAVTLEQAADLPHVWPFFRPWLPEAGATLGRLAAWIRQVRARS